MRSQEHALVALDMGWEDAGTGSVPLAAGAEPACLDMGAGGCDWTWNDPADLAEGESAMADLLEALGARSARGGDFHCVIRVRGWDGAPWSQAIEGALRSLKREWPALTWNLLVVPAGGAPASVPARPDAVLRWDGLRWSVLVRSVRRWDAGGPVGAGRGGVHVLTGGSGGVARLLAGHWRSRDSVLVLCGRSATPPSWFEEVGGGALRVEWRQLDPVRPEAVEELLQEVETAHGEIDAVMHSAGAHRDARLSRKTREGMLEVFAPKIRATVALADAVRRRSRTVLVTFSSLTGHTGNPGQVEYALANRFQWAVSSGDRVRSIAWPLWEGAGMRMDQAQRELIAEHGHHPMPASTGFEVLDHVLAHGGQPVLAYGDEARLRREVSGLVDRDPSPDEDADSSVARLVELLRTVIGQATGLDVSRVAADSPLEESGLDSILATKVHAGLKERFPTVPRTFLYHCRTLVDGARFLRTHSGASMRADSADGPVATSILASPDRKASQAPATAGGGNGIPFLPARRGNSRRGELHPRGAIAVVGMAGRYPGAADLGEFWRNLASGRDCIGPVPVERWRSSDHFDPDPSRSPEGSLYLERGGFLADPFRFDEGFFRMSPHEAVLTDPQERLFLEVAWEALEDAGATPSSLRRRLGLPGERPVPVGVFVGCSSSTWGYRAQEFQGGKGEVPPASLWSIANRVSWVFDFSGPSMPVDTACSSSLVALHLACESLRRGEVPVALVGGVNLYMHQSKWIALSQARMLSPTGKCSFMGAGADGFVPGEGVGALVLKRLEDAVADGDRVHGVVLATAVNHGGRTHGFTVPNPAAQARLIRDGIREAGIEARSVTYHEAHGTGTRLGDPIELSGLDEAFDSLGSRPDICRIGSVKSNIGHLEAAAGLASVTKVLLQMRHRTLVPTLHASPENPDLPATSTRFVPVDHLDAWRSRGARIAGVSSFGAGGANAFCLLQEASATDADRPLPAEGPRLLQISGRTPEHLRANMERLGRWVESVAVHPLDAVVSDSGVGSDPLAWTVRDRYLLRDAAACRGITIPDEALADGTEFVRYRERRISDDSNLLLRDLSHTLREGREEEPFRAAFVAGSLVGLSRDLLDAAAKNGRMDPADPGLDATFRNEAGSVFLKGLLEQGDLRGLGALWARGVSLRGVVPSDGKMVDAPGTVFLGRRHDLTRTSSLIHEAGTESGVAAGILALGWKSCEGMAADDAGFDAILSLRPAARSGSVRQLRPDLSGDGPADHVAAGSRQVGELRRTHPGELRLLDLAGMDATDESLWWWRVGALRSLEASSARSTWIHGHRPSSLEGRFRGLLAGVCWERASILAGVSVQVEGSLEPDTLSWRRCSPRPGGFARLRMDRLGLHQPVMVPAGEAGRRERVERWLVTGAFGGLGKLVCRSLVAGGVRSLLLVGRNPPGDEFRTNLEEWRRGGIQVEVANLDVSDLQAMERNPALRDWLGGGRWGVMHCAGSIDRDHLAFADKSVASIAAVLGSKARGARNLLAVAGGARPDRLVVFSSVSGMVPGLAGGMSDYAAANAELDDLVEELRSSGMDAQSLCWPTWSQTGMGNLQSPEFLRLGFHALTSEEGCRLLEQVMKSATGVVLPWSADGSGRLKLDDLLRSKRGATMDKAAPKVDSAAAGVQWMAADPGLLWRRRLCQGLGLSEDGIDPHAPFSELGLDSILAVRVVESFRKETGIEISTSSLFDHPTLAGMEEFVRRTAEESDWKAPTASAASPCHPSRPAAGAPDEPASESAASGDDVAIVGMAGRFPGADDVHGFWNLLLSGASSIGPVPPERWRIEDHFDPSTVAKGKSYARVGGFLRDAALFDPAFFGMNPEEAKLADPQQRLFLETAWNAFEDAGLGPHRLAGTRCGIWAGVAASDYVFRVVEQGATGAPVMLGNHSAVLAARLSYLFDLRGPAMAIDTACSSSLVAFHEACQSLRLGETDVALAGGVHVAATEKPFVFSSAAGMLSRSGRCSAFDAEADGLVIGEGVAAVVLKRLADARRDGDRILAVVRGTGVAQDGRTNGLTAPNPAAQARLQQDVLERFGIDPCSIGYVEAHGTGTSLGDPVEIEALARTFRALEGGERRCYVGSTKPAIGHTYQAAGIVGIVKAVQCLRHGIIPPTINHRELNPRIRKPDFLEIPTTAVPWPSEPVRRAAVSAFGYAGTLAHVILEEWIDPVDPVVPDASGSLDFVLSAKTDRDLAEVAARLGRWMDEEDNPDPRELAAELARVHGGWRIRAAFRASRVEEVRAFLRRIAQGEKGRLGEGVSEPVSVWVAGGDLPRELLARRRSWASPRIPGHPMNRIRCWMEPSPSMTGLGVLRDWTCATDTAELRRELAPELQYSL